MIRRSIWHMRIKPLRVRMGPNRQSYPVSAGSRILSP